MDKILSFVKEHWKLLLAAGLIIMTIVIFMTGWLNQIVAWIFGFAGTGLAGAELQRGRQNTVAKGREEKIGQPDDKGIVQVAVVETEAGKVVTDEKQAPSGVKPKDITSDISVSVAVKPETTITESSSFFKNRRKTETTGVSVAGNTDIKAGDLVFSKSEIRQLNKQHNMPIVDVPKPIITDTTPKSPLKRRNKKGTGESNDKVDQD